MAEEFAEFRGFGPRDGSDRAAAWGDDSPPPECPIIALGHDDGRYHYFSPSGEQREFGFRELRSDAGQISLFDGDPAYLKAVWQARGRNGRPVDDWDAKAAHAGLVAMAVAAGKWDPETPLRGRGVWRGPDNRLICHSGDGLLFSDGERSAPGRRIGPALYPTKARIAAPATEPALARDVREWKKDFALWQWRPVGAGGANSDRGPASLAGDMLFNAVSLAYLGAGPRWRVHVAIEAVGGAGKSTLMRFIGAALGNAASLNGVTEAGFRNALSDEARPTLLDEAEGGNDVTAALIEVIRRMSDDSGKGARGDGGGPGQARYFQISSPVFMFCINPPVLLPQDRSRIVTLSMDRAIAANEGRAYNAIERAGELSAALRARALFGWERFRRNLPLVRAALIERGCSLRQADQLGSLIAAGAVMTDDDPLDPAAADHLAEAAVPLIEELAAEESDNSDALRCWRTLVTRRTDAWRGGEAQTVGSLLIAGQDATESEARRALNNQCGLRLILKDDAGGTMPEAPCLYVANQHDFLDSAYRDTVWRGGGWATSLARLMGAARSKAAVRVGGMKQRAVAIPLWQLPQPDVGGTDPPDD